MYGIYVNLWDERALCGTGGAVSIGVACIVDGRRADIGRSALLRAHSRRGTNRKY